MSWRPKEKEFTVEEAIEISRKELAPHWYNSTPLIGGISLKKKTAVFTLDEEFLKGDWVLLLVDPTQVLAEEALYFQREWRKRYNPFGVRFLLILENVFQTFLEKKPLKAFMESNTVKYPMCVDHDGLLNHSFNANPLPSILLLSKGEALEQQTGEIDYTKFELNLQNHLRKEDPGLSLLPVFESSKEFLKMVQEINLGEGKGAAFTEDEPDEEKLQIKGGWKQDPERLVTNENDSSISFMSDATALSVVCEPLGKGETGRITVTVDGAPAIDVFAGSNLEFDDTGLSMAWVREFKLLHLLKGMQKKTSKITLGFPSAKRVPIALYGVRLAD